MKSSQKWQVVEERLEELRKLVEEKWEKGEWQLAVFGEGTIRSVEKSKASAQEMRQQADDCMRTMGTLRSHLEGNSP